MAMLPISESEAERDFPGMMAQVRGAKEIAIECDSKVVAVVRPADDEFRPRLVSELIAEEKMLEAALSPSIKTQLSASFPAASSMETAEKPSERVRSMLEASLQGPKPNLSVWLFGTTEVVSWYKALDV